MLTKLVIDASTGESKTVEMTPEEVEQLKIMQAEADAANARAEAEQKAKEEAKASALAKLAALGLTEEEAKAILG